MCAVMPESSNERQTPVFSSEMEMEFTNEELMWLLNISPEVPVGKLTQAEERWCELAKPKTETAAELFQLLASIRFGLTDHNTSSMDMLTITVEKLSKISV